MAFDVGAITRELQSQFNLFCYSKEECETKVNTATPEHVGRLLAALSVMTEQLAVARTSSLDEDFYLGGAPGGMAQWDADFVAWRERLARYQGEVAEAPPGDRQDILWSTTAPLLLGFFGGENSDEPQRAIDAVTPFSLANQLALSDEWRSERLSLFWEDVKEEAKKVVVTTLGSGVGILAAAVIVALLVRR